MAPVGEAEITVGAAQISPTAASSHRRFGFRRGLIAVCALALVVRLVAIASTPHFVPNTDAADYDRIAVTLADTHSFAPSVLAPAGGPSAFRPPLFPVGLAGVYAVVGTKSPTDRWDAGRVLEAVLGAIAVALVGLIAVRFWGPAPALLSAAIAAIYPPLVRLGTSLMSESLFIPLMLGAVLTALVYRDAPHRRRWAILTGLLLGCAALTRANGLLLLLPICFLVWHERPRRSLRSLLGPALVVVVAIAVVLPWTVRNAHLFGQLVPISTESGYLLAGTYNRYSDKNADDPALWIVPVPQMRQILARAPQLNEAQISGRLNRTAFDYIEAHPGYVLKATYWDTIRLLELTGTRLERNEARYVGYWADLTAPSVYAFWLVALLAVVGAFTRAARRPPAAFWACPAVIVVAGLPLAGSARYRSPADPFLIMLAALALVYIWRRLRGGARSAPVRPAA